VFHVGRLDVDTEGLLLLTNDGELANRISHPSHGVSKTYVATVAGQVDQQLRVRLRRPVDLDDGPVSIDACRIVAVAEDRSVVEVSLHEGRNRIVRRVFDALGHPVQRLVRTRVGPVRLGGQRPGEIREITGKQLQRLYTEVGL
jgi:23S rRNA pseudouridine2605 synthase